MKLILTVIAVLATSQLSFGAVVASKVTCAELKSTVAAGENTVIGKNGHAYSMLSDCGVFYFFKAADGLCYVGKNGTAAYAEACAPQEYNGGN